MRNNTRCWRLGGTRLIITLALQTVVGVAFGQTTDSALSSSYTFVFIDTPRPDGRLGFTLVRDINDKGELVVEFTTGSPTPTLLLDRFEVTPA